MEQVPLLWGLLFFKYTRKLGLNKILVTWFGQIYENNKRKAIAIGLAAGAVNLKNSKRAYFDQQAKWAATVCWSEYTTYRYVSSPQGASI